MTGARGGSPSDGRGFVDDHSCFHRNPSDLNVAFDPSERNASTSRDAIRLRGD
jgi:hypothetical protein